MLQVIMQKQPSDRGEGSSKDTCNNGITSGQDYCISKQSVVVVCNHNHNPRSQSTACILDLQQ